VTVRLRLLLVLQLAAAAAVAAAGALALGLPLLAGRVLSAWALGGLVLVQALLVVAVGGRVLGRNLVAPLERLLRAASRLGRGGALPPLGPPEDAHAGGPARAAIAFERIAAALADEQAQLRAKVAELEETNRMLGRAREQLARSERLAVVGQLAAGIAHEVGNPLGAVVGFAELARARLAGAGGDGAHAAADCVARIAIEAKRIDGIVRDLLDFARPSPAAARGMSVPAAIEAAARLARAQPRCRDVSIALELAPELPLVRGDEGRLTQVFLNLLLNAGDAMGGRGTVRVGARVAGDQVEVEVADGGPGIPQEHLAQIFDPFFTTKPPGAGIGLGLSVCHRLVEAMGGTIQASNGERGGAVFRLTLPRDAPEAGAATAG
jgi:signal transduction histidine kinase